MATPTTDLTVDDPHALDGHAGGDGGHYDENGELMLVGHDGELHPAHLQHFFVSAEQQFEASKLGMWLFLATEILLFGGMFVAYGIFRIQYPELFEEASQQLDTVLGATNTLILLLSSFTMAKAIRAIQMDNVKHCVRYLVATVLLASGFLVVKYFEYEHKFSIGIFPGESFQLDEGTSTVGDLAAGTAVLSIEPDALDVANDLINDPARRGGLDAEATAVEHAADEAHAADGEHADDHGREGPIFANRRAGIFFSIYYMMTGIHAFHIVIGIIAISILALKAHRRRYSSVWYTPVENVGLYWHIVDVIWIFVFPLMYLI